jgi:hypothetical protein
MHTAALGPKCNSIRSVPGDLYPRVKRPKARLTTSVHLTPRLKMLSGRSLYLAHDLMTCWLIKDRSTVTSSVPLKLYNNLKQKVICLVYQNCVSYKNCVNYKNGCEFVSCQKIRTRIKIKEHIPSTRSNITGVKCSPDFKLSGECT